MNTQPRRIMPATDDASLAVHDDAATRRWEAAAMAAVPPFSLMASAGQALARLAVARVPHARRIWVAAGPGNNGGDGLVAAKHLHRAGLSVTVSLGTDPSRLPDDARRAHADAVAAGVRIQTGAPEEPSDVIIDALLGIGQARAPAQAILDAVRWVQAARRRPGTFVLAADVPTGLSSGTGRALGPEVVQAHATLSFLSLKPGLFTGQGRDLCGEVWWSDLAAPAEPAATAILLGRAQALMALPPRPHVQHKGSFGDLWVIAGASGMLGAGVLAARAGLAAGAGRVFYAPLDGVPALPDTVTPELMWRASRAWHQADILEASTVVCGCGGGDAVRSALSAVLSRASRLVLDADGLNVLAGDESLRRLLTARRTRGRATIITPHPLEAARLLACTVAEVQADRLQAAQRLADLFGVVTVLKGSGSIIASPDAPASINPTGNACLATPGSGDVLAGWLGGLWSRQGSAAETSASSRLTLSHQVACAAVWLHGHAADVAADTERRLPLTASDLVTALARSASPSSD